jgi:hypothetical protein
VSSLTKFKLGVLCLIVGGAALLYGLWQYVFAGPDGLGVRGLSSYGVVGVFVMSFGFRLIGKARKGSGSGTG